MTDEVNYEVRKLTDLTHDQNNANRGTERGKKLLNESLRDLGAGRSILLDAEGRIIAGNKTTAEARELGMDDVIIVKTDGSKIVAVQRTDLDLEKDPRAKRLALMDNRVAEIDLEWDEEVLALLRAEYPETLDGLWTEEELSQIINATADKTGGNGAAQDVEPRIEIKDELQAQYGVETGQIWQLGNHKIICGDCTDPAVVAAVMGEGKATICWTDPPWNVAYGASKNPRWRQREIINDDLGQDFGEFCGKFTEMIKASLVPGGMLYMAMSAQEWPVIDKTLRDFGFHWSSTIIWVKNYLVLSRKDYHTQYEPIWYGWLGTASRVHPLDDRAQSDTWFIDRPRKSEEHPTMKPVELVQRSLQNSSSPGDLVFEPFSGSGTTIIASELSGRHCRAIEQDPGYVAVAIHRWKEATGNEPVKL